MLFEVKSCGHEVTDAFDEVSYLYPDISEAIVVGTSPNYHYCFCVYPGWEESHENT